MSRAASSDHAFSQYGQEIQHKSRSINSVTVTIIWRSISMRAGRLSCNLIGREPVLVWIYRSSYIPIRRLA